MKGAVELIRVRAGVDEDGDGTVPRVSATLIELGAVRAGAPVSVSLDMEPEAATGWSSPAPSGWNP